MRLSRQAHFNQALMRIPRRAESTDRSTLAMTFVSAGSFSAMLHSTDHQILYGRRGTGKTHALLYLSDLIERTGDVAVYVDLRTIGSADGMYTDSNLSPTIRGTHLLVDTLEAIQDELLSVAFKHETGDQNALLLGLDALAEAATAVKVVGEVEQETTLGGSAESGVGLELSVSPNAKVSATRRRSATAESRLRRTGIERHHVVFGPLSRALRGITSALGSVRLWLLLDEWSSIPLDLQPLLADLLRRSVLPTAGITVKIATIERRSRFSQPSLSRDYVGIEVGADAASAVSLDDFMIFDNVRSRAQEFFGQLFYNHASARLSTMIYEPPSNPDSFIEATFHRNSFPELVRAAEGVPRDAINIAALAAQHARDELIGLPDVRRAARDWYLRDKQTAINANEPARQMLRLLIDEVVGRRRSRTFLLDQLDARHETIDELCDARLLHVLRRGIADPKSPGTLYDGFAIDYGCYVDLHFRPRDRGGWLNSPKGVPPDEFSRAREAINLAKLE
ncbi:MAG: hypothetical protein JO309_06830 [Pseudonocardiales bacterium]|nr:hypothetical protein [Pseudonocardiales bacterium]MBV9729109.1 hypothetical protein [Pseudonocardiales bacterium]